ncbi:uncharacterized protein N0V89_000881 [Didymosphaeria variabile]|uniref:Uncharacterized protein n=1 Tax=Didymosphaeria variabile TaxID=1932322 RepID=A0A9W9CG92_9PLEO|nr:uncharacterized protein N0V89_000881 [Didymosphaeria variabile]KAJ4360320.1 hypothetical protein N0V89_000881 [Didymosphaeria variabile]
MITDTRQGLQKRMAAIFAEAKEQGLNVCDTLPSEVLDHFLVSLKTENICFAPEEEAKGMEEKNLDLETQLKQAQQALQNIDIPEDANQLQVELGLAKKSADFYRGLMNEAEERATRYQEKWQEALQQQVAAEEMDNKFERLKAENSDLRRSKSIIAEEMRKMKDIYDKLRDKDLGVVVDKEEKVMALEKQLKELKATSEELQEENCAVEGQYHEVMSSLDAVVTETTDDLNAAKARARAAEQQQSATFSEIQPLRRFYNHANDILNIYQGIFRQLLNAVEQNVTYSSDFREMLLARLQAASGECEAFLTLRALFAAEGLPQTEHSEQLSDLAQSAQQMQKCLDNIGQDMVQFLWALSRRPDILKLIRLKFSVLR